MFDGTWIRMAVIDTNLKYHGVLCRKGEWGGSFYLTGLSDVRHEHPVDFNFIFGWGFGGGMYDEQRNGLMRRLLNSTRCFDALMFLK